MKDFIQFPERHENLKVVTDYQTPIRETPNDSFWAEHVNHWNNRPQRLEHIHQSFSTNNPSDTSNVNKDS